MNISLPQILDVALGLILIYLTLSIFASEIQEILTAWLQFRAKHLKKSIYRLFGGTQNSKYLEQQLKGIKEEKINFCKPNSQKARNQEEKALQEEKKIICLVRELYEHPAISSTTQTTLGISVNNDISQDLYGPSYIIAEDFSEALLDIICLDFNWEPNVNFETIMQDLKPKLGQKKELFCDKSLKRLYEVAEVAKKWHRKRILDKSDLELFKFSLEDWYNKAQYHTSGTYKRNSKYLLFLIGLMTAILLNVNTFQITKNLLIHPENNLDIELISGEIIKGCDTSINPSENVSYKNDACQQEIQRVYRILDNIQSSNLPIGWSIDTLTFNNLVSFFGNYYNNPSNFILKLLYHLMGWIISALAIMMGASFWFDILQRFVNIRNTVAPPASASSSKLESEATDNKK